MAGPTDRRKTIGIVDPARWAGLRNSRAVGARFELGVAKHVPDGRGGRKAGPSPRRSGFGRAGGRGRFISAFRFPLSASWSTDSQRPFCPFANVPFRRVRPCGAEVDVNSVGLGLSSAGSEPIRQEEAVSGRFRPFPAFSAVGGLEKRISDARFAEV